MTAAPTWAADITHPEPGAVEYLHEIGTLVCRDSVDALAVTVVRRDTEDLPDDVHVIFAGSRLTLDEAARLIRLVRAALDLIPDRADRGEPVLDPAGGWDRDSGQGCKR